MGIIHTHLSSKYPSYASWHDHPRRSGHHLFAFFAIAVLLGTGLYSSIETTEFSYAEVPEVRAVHAPSVRSLTNQFFGLLSAYENAPADRKGVARSELEAKISERASALALLIEKSPELALLDVLPEDVINALPADIAVKLEQYVTIDGPVSIFHEDFFDQGTESVEFRVNDKSGKGQFVLRTPGEIIEVRPGDEFKVKGVSLGGNLLFAGGTQTVTPTGPSEFGISDSYSTGSKKMLVMMISFTDNASQPYTADQMRGIMFTNPGSVAAHYTENSFGKLTLSGDVVPLYIAVPYSSADVCGSYFDAAIAAAVAGAQAQGFNPSNYQIHTVMNPPVGCRGGAAYYPGTWAPAAASMNNMYGSASMQEVIEHELGHNLAENHSATYTCGSQSIANTGCAQSEYADQLDPLGNYNGLHTHFNVAHKNGMGWMTAANVQNVTGSGTFTIAPLETLTTGVQALRVPKSDTGQQYYVGYRQPVGIDAGLYPGVMTGVGIWLTNDASQYPDYTRLLDLTPGDGIPMTNSALSDGMTFTDTANGLTITQVSHDASGVTVNVTKTAAPCVPGQTTASLSPGTQTTSADGATLQYTFTVTNRDSSTCSPVVYALSGTVPTGWVGVLGSVSLNVNPGASVSTTFRTTPPVGTSNGSYPISAGVAGLDPSHTAQSTAVHVIFLDTQSPTTTITAPASGSVIKTVSLTVSATASDNIKVTKVDFYLDNVLQASDATSPFSVKMNTKKLSAGAHTITAKAYDAAGNIGTASINVTK